jgi:PKD repeat protein
MKKTPQILFNDSGSYYLKLVVGTKLGCYDSITQKVIIYDSPKASFVHFPKYGSPPLEVSFVNNSIGANIYEWDIEGELYNDKDIKYKFLDTGMYDVVLREQ